LQLGGQHIGRLELGIRAHGRCCRNRASRHDYVSGVVRRSPDGPPPSRRRPIYVIVLIAIPTRLKALGPTFRSGVYGGSRVGSSAGWCILGNHRRVGCLRARSSDMTGPLAEAPRLMSHFQVAQTGTPRSGRLTGVSPNDRSSRCSHYPASAVAMRDLAEQGSNRPTSTLTAGSFKFLAALRFGDVSAVSTGFQSPSGTNSLRTARVDFDDV